MSSAILLYHRIAEPGDFFGLSVPLEDFAAQMEHVRSCCQPVSLDTLAETRAIGRPLERAVVVTFDDGYADSLAAVPILSQLGIPATLFMTTDALDETPEYWWDTLTRLLLEEPALPVTIDAEIEGLGSMPSVTLRDRQGLVSALHRRIRHFPVAKRREALDRLGCRIQPTSTVHAYRMSGAQIAQLAAVPGIEIGAHTTHHLSLPSHPAAAQREEILESRDTLTSLTGRDVTSIAYPFGEASRETLAITTSLGFRNGTVVQQRSEPGFERLTMRRLDVAALDKPFSEALDSAFDESAFS